MFSHRVRVFTFAGAKKERRSRRKARGNPQYMQDDDDNGEYDGEGGFFRDDAPHVDGEVAGKDKDADWREGEDEDEDEDEIPMEELGKSKKKAKRKKAPRKRGGSGARRKTPNDDTSSDDVEIVNVE